MKKGFTLIELLATIVILAVVSLITIPIITGVINKTRINSLKSSAYGLLEASNLYIAQYNPDNTIRFDIDNNKVISNDTTNLLKYKGSIKEGTVIINAKGKVTVCITDGKNSAYKNYNENKVTLVEKNKCTIPDNTSIVYLDNKATITELSNQELTDEIATLKEEIENLKSDKANKNEVTSIVDTLATKSEVQQVNTTLSGNMSSINNSLIERINQLNSLKVNKEYEKIGEAIGSTVISFNKQYTDYVICFYYGGYEHTIYIPGYLLHQISSHRAWYFTFSSYAAQIRAANGSVYLEYVTTPSGTSDTNNGAIALLAR